MDRLSENKELLIEEVDPRDPDAVRCLSNYYAELARRFERGFEVSLSRDPEARDMIRPCGAFFVAYLSAAAVGCVGLKGLGDGQAEIKRLWVSPIARKRGIAKRLMTAAETSAKELKISVLKLDTNSALPEASALYTRLGWREIERFNDDPYPDLFFEKRL